MYPHYEKVLIVRHTADNASKHEIWLYKRIFVVRKSYKTQKAQDR